MPTQNIHIIGIGGSGASGVARYLHAIGFEVTGSDPELPRTVELKKLGIRVYDSHGAVNIGKPDLVLMSPGVFSADEEIKAAKKKGIPVLSWQEFMGRFLTRRPGKGFMVAGTFGKGSTAGILSHVLAAAYLDPLVILGVEDAAWNSNLRLGFGEFWVMEADEYNRHFHHYHPSYVCLTSLEHEHASTYPTYHDYLEGFRAFFKGMADPKIIVAKRTPAIDAALSSVIPPGAVTYSITDDADVRGTILEETVEGSRFVLNAPKFNVTNRELHLRVPGRIHIENSVGAVALALAAGIDVSAANAGLATFAGLRRRFEVVEDGRFVTIFDYAHTPDRIRAVLEQTRKLYPGRRVVVLFEPHLYSRTMQFREGFRAILGTADRVYVTDIYPSREARSELGKHIHSRDLVTQGNDTITYVGTLEEGVAAVKRARTERDILLVLGAGPIQFAAATLAAS